MIIKSSEKLRELTGSFYANADFSRIESIIKGVEDEIAGIIGREIMAEMEIESEGQPGSMEIITDDEGRRCVGSVEVSVDEEDNVLFDGYSPYGLQVRVEGGTCYISNAKALVSCQQAIAYMATMRYYRLNDISHEDMGRKVKIDRENEARPFEWQLARDDRAHLEEYYRALDRLIGALDCDPRFRQTSIWKRKALLIVKDADTLASLTGIDPSPWLFLRLVPYLSESQHFVSKAYGTQLSDLNLSDDLLYASQMAVALGAIALMGRRTSLQTLPYGLMKLFESDGGGNRREAAPLDRLDGYLKHLSKEQHYWLNEMKQLRDKAAGQETETYLQMPENNPRNKFMRV
jgi:hypothetical protein